MSNDESILADVPLEDPEQDRLGISGFAGELANAICQLSADDCVVFALYGAWGTGKTTCLNFVLHYVNHKPDDERPTVVRFNPWWFSGRGELLGQFFREFNAAVGKGGKFEKVIGLIADVVQIASEIPEPTGLGKGAGKLVARRLRAAAKGKQAHEVRAEIRSHLRAQDGRILVIIDDIDRLPADEIRSLFRVIKAVADFPRTVYLLSFDKNVVVKALRDLQGTAGEAYLEKIVQVPFDLPAPDKASLRNLFREQFEAIFMGTPEGLIDQTYFGNVFWDGIDHFFTTMRDVKRATNALKLLYPLVKGEVNPTDFVAIETIRVFCPDVYRIIRSNPDMFAGYWDNNSYPKLEDMKRFHNFWLEKVAAEHREAVRALVTRVFPKLETALGGSAYGAEWGSTWRRELRICSPDVFPVYFRLEVPEAQISNTEMSVILQMTADSEGFGNKLLDLCEEHRPDGSTRLSGLLERIQDYTEKDIPQERIPSILSALLNNWGDTTPISVAAMSRSLCSD